MKLPILPLAAVLAALAAARAGGATTTDFAKTFAVTVPAGLADEPITNFPLLVRLGSGIQGFDYDDFRQDGADLLVTDTADNPLPYELENWDTNGTSRLWVQVPSVETGTVVHVYYGSYETVTPVPGMWSGYAGVWHLNETGDGAVSVLDATTNALNGTAQSVSAAVAGGALGGARSIAPNNDHAPGIIVDVLSDPAKKAAAERLGTDFHASFWMLTEPGTKNGAPDYTTIKWGNLLGRRKGDKGTSWGFAFEGERPDKVFNVDIMRVFSGSETIYNTTNKIGSILKVNDGVWKKVDVVWRYVSNNNVPVADIYTNGVFVESVALNEPVAQEDANIGIGCSTQTTYGSSNVNQKGRRFRGSMDEVRLRYGAASAARIAAEWRQESGSVSAVCGAAVNVDDSAPVLGAPSIVRNANGTFTVSVAVSESDAAAGSVKCLAGGGEFAMSTADATLPKTYSGTLSALAGLPASTTLVYSVQARSTGGTTVSRNGAEAFFTGDLAVAKIADGDEDGFVPAVFRISRADTALDLPFSFSLGGTAVEGRTYRTIPHAATIPAGATSADVEITPLLDSALDVDSTVVLSLLPGLYGVAAAAGSATATLSNLVLNTWIASDAGLASDGANWAYGHAPRANEHVLFDGRYSNASCEWDALATHEVAAWTQNNGYTGTVTVCTVFPGKGDFTNFVVAGPMVLESGSVSHPQSRVMAERHDETWDWIGDIKSNAVYRLRLSVGSLTVGPDAMIDARGKGYYVTENGAAVPGCAHGGRMDAGSLPCYGDPREPVFIGAPYHRLWGNRWNGKGGGAVYVVAAGAIVVDGTIRADSWDGSIFTGPTEYGGAMGAAGSVFLCADTLSGTGRITAMGTGAKEEGVTFDDTGYTIKTDGNFKGTGGRVAIRTREPVDRSTFDAISAEGFWMGSPGANWCANYSGGSGTVVFIDQTHPNGLLVLSQQPGADPPSLRPGKITFHRCPSVTTDADWTFDAIEFGRRGFLRVPAGTTLTLPGGLASCYGTETDFRTFGGIRYEGGTINAGEGDQTIAGNWTFFAWSNYVFSANVIVTNGATIGVPPITDIFDNGTLPEIIPTCSVEVAGNLLVGANAAIRATDCGIVATNDYAADVATGEHSHGGRALYRGRDATGAPESRAFDSVFAPSLPGCTAGAGLGVFANDKTQRGGGAVRVVVGGTLTLDGEATVSGLTEERTNQGGRTGGAGGTLDVTAGRLSGAGTMRANGGNYNEHSGPGGRIAVRLTAPGADFEAFSGRIEAGGGSWWKGFGDIHDASAGTVYLETSSDVDKGGTIRIAMDPVNIGYIKSRIKGGSPDNTNTTEMVSLGFGGDRLGDYKHARYVVSDYGRAAVNADFKARSVELSDLTAFLDLEGHTLTVDEFFYAIDDGEGGIAMRRLGTGTHSAAALAALGAAVADTSAGATGRVIVRGRETLMILR